MRELDLKPTKKITLPPIHTQSQCRRVKTLPDDFVPNKSCELLKLESALTMSKSRVMTEMSRRLPSLESLKLVEGGAVRKVVYAGHIRIPTVHNDYHNSKTKGGYARSKLGGIFPK